MAGVIEGSATRPTSGEIMYEILKSRFPGIFKISWDFRYFSDFKID